MKLDNVRLLVGKFDEMFRFYRDKLGLEVTWGKEGDVYAQFKFPEGGDLAIFSEALMAQTIGTSDIGNSDQSRERFSLIVRVENVDEWHKKLSSKGVRFITPPTNRADWGIRTAHLRDPESNLIELVSDLEK